MHHRTNDPTQFWKTFENYIEHEKQHCAGLKLESNKDKGTRRKNTCKVATI